jgi:hypothetical protein
MLGHSLDVGNPFLWHTKAEVVQLIAVHGKANWIETSISCTHLSRSGGAEHCGDCTQCLQRRFGILAAGLAAHDPVGGYAIELLTQERDDHSTALSVVSSALEFPRWSFTGFLHRYAGEVLGAAASVRSENVDAFVRNVYDLHCRYGREVGLVIDSAIRSYAPNIREKTLAPRCLLRAVIADGRIELDRAPLKDPFPREDPNPDVRDLRHSTQIQLAFDTDRKRIVLEGLGSVGTAGQYVLLSVLAAQYRLDRQAELLPRNHMFVSIAELMDRLNVDNETAVRQQIAKLRKVAADLAEERWGLVLGRDAIIENRSGAGYRLNPAVLLVDINELT